MSLRQISLNNFRNLHPTTINFHHRCNIITGENASGKSSLLEALHIICQGQSFRTKIIDQCISHDQKEFLLFSKFDLHNVGFSRVSNQSTIRVDGENINRLSQLAKLNPVRVMNNESFNLIVGQPGHKRDYLDWILFHVEHQYLRIRTDYYHALKQRNSILKSKTNLKQLHYWDKYLVEYGENVCHFRKQYMEAIFSILNNQLVEMISDLGLSINYEPGWNTKAKLLNIYQDQQKKDIQLGYTRSGIHRDDIEIFSFGSPVKEVLSRGQIKRLSISLLLSQILLLKEKTNKPIIILIDDIASELDQQTIEKTINIIKKLDIQVFITNISTHGIPLRTAKECKMFHVEHGMIKAVKH